MYLKKLELSGFKSFAKKTTLDFPRGVTVVAGPNGSGKSNVVDAIRWALAEQSYKNLRGKKGEDLIFYGSGTRGSLSRASVAMSFDMSKDTKGNPEGYPLDFSEAVLAREVDKSGENSYILNGRKVRLTDMEEFLAKSRIGDSSFRVLSQGMSDKLLTLSPQEFGGFIEEAAGVKEFQDKKSQTLLKLKNTRENLEKVSAILAEIKPQLKILKREKDKLEKKEEYSSELKNSAKTFFGLKYQAVLSWERKISGNKKNIKQQLTPLYGEVKGLKEEIFSFEKKSALNSELAGLSADVRKLENESNEITREIILTEGKINLEEEREKQKLPVSVEYLKGKIGEIAARINIDLNGMDTYSLRKILAAVAISLQDLLKAIEHGIDPAGAANTIPILKSGLEKLLTRQDEVRSNLEKAQLVRTQKEKQLMEERHISIAKEKSYREKESELYNLEGSLRQIELEEEKLKLHKDKLHQDISSIGVITLAEILDFNQSSPTRTVLASDPQNESLLEEKLWKLKRKVEEIGSIDANVVKEYEGVNERFAFLSKESEDLSQALASLDELIKNLDKQISGKYKTTLSEMNHAFGGYFRTIFGGGRASLSEKSQIPNPKSQSSNLVENLDNDDDLNGVEIKLELPDKKVKNLNTLSGGERTLASIALLFALASIRKPPVMVLDEIDAALDETNTQKFARLLKELSKQTQFIVITHNSETMRGADVLYGVSMKDGISHLLSLKLQSA